MQQLTCFILYFFSILLLHSSISFAQGLFSEEIVIIQSLANGATSVYTADLDGDGDMDVLSASFADNKIAWYENTDGQGSFGAQQVITTSAVGARSVYAADLDGDGDMDVLSASEGDDKIAWYENTDGQGSFGARQVITSSADEAESVYATDLDGDGDMDVLSASYWDDKIAWYENTDGQGSFGAQRIISTSAVGAWSVYAADLDGDGDMDVLSALYWDGKIAWYKNINGQGSFGAQQVITTSAVGAASVYAADLDGDGDMDVLSASVHDDKMIAWYENTNGQGSFGAQQAITTSAVWAASVYAADLDGDGDMDVLSASASDDKIAWYENTDGQGSFGVQQVITTSADEAESVCAADLDGDGDMDVLSASYGDNKIAWYRNLHPTSVSTTIQDLKEFDLSPNYPNPFNPTTFISYKLATVSDVELTIHNQLGQEIRTLVKARKSAGTYHQIEWDGRDNVGKPVASGIYLYRLKAGSFVQTRKMVLLR